jgi:hypothetical protein
MEERLALKLLRKIMSWDEETATREYRWVRLMSRLKFDGYQDYLAGVRFAESLAGWLQQFVGDDRMAAYSFIKSRLIYFSALEIQRLVDQFYPRFVEPQIRRAVAELSGVAPYLVWADAGARQLFERMKRQTLFVGLSDGARLDLLRRANSGVLANDQIVLATHIDDEKWQDLGSKLAEDKLFDGQPTPKFELVCLIDDFTASGTTFLRRKGDGSWTGKLYKFWSATSEARRRQQLPLADDYKVQVHHYISTTQARETITARLGELKEVPASMWFANVSLTEGVLLPSSTALAKPKDEVMLGICEKYYDHDLFERLREHLPSDQKDLRYGYANCTLPVVLEHNCPNNAISLLWADTEGKHGHEMRPLFCRRHRHS